LIVTEISRRRQIFEGLPKMKIFTKIVSLLFELLHAANRQRDVAKLIAEFFKIFVANAPIRSYYSHSDPSVFE
jgi:hypothetical protein